MIEANVISFVSRMEKMEEAQRQLDSSVDLLNQCQKKTDDVVDDLKTEQKVLLDKSVRIETEVNELSERVSKVERYHSEDKPNKIFFYPPDRLKHFVGRKTELNELEEQFVCSEDSFQTKVISGLGGSGKTTLAIEYAWLMQKFYHGGVFWFSAENISALETSVAQLAFDSKTVGSNMKETLMLHLKWFNKLALKWLLVVDNVDEDEMSNELKDLLMGTWRRNSKGHLLITTRRETNEVVETLKVEPTDCVVLQPMTSQESITFMLKRTEREEENDESLEKLVEELDGLPLAMEQAAAHIKTLNCSFKEYLNKFEKKRLKLLSKNISTSYPIAKERLAIKTTWQLNFDYISRHSEEEGLGNAAHFIMQIVAFFHPDDIPQELINKGNPEIEDESLKDVLEDSIGVKQVIVILTRFSLFQHYRGNTLQVHRLVQEVIRDSIVNKTDKLFVIQAAVRMLHAALQEASSPEDALKLQGSTDEMRGKLHLWSKLGTTATKLRRHINDFVQKYGFEKELYWTFETCKIYQTSALFDSIYQRQAEALAAQDQMLNMMSLGDLSEDQQNKLTSVTIPVHEKERFFLQECIASIISIEDGNESDIADPETLRIFGNKAFHENDNQGAIQLYTEGIRASKEEPDIRLLCNRSLCFLKVQDYENALADANHCIELEPSNWKAHCWRAYAVANLINIGKVSKRMEASGQASASIAGYLNPKCKLELKMKVHYPILLYQVINDSEALQTRFTSVLERPFTTLLLQKGKYNIKAVVPVKSIQVVGIEDGVEIFIDGILPLFRPSQEMFAVDFEPEKELYIHFERVIFVTGGNQIVAGSGTLLSFYRCTFSNGAEACDDFPHCEGGRGCKNTNPDRCRTQAETIKKSGMSAFGRTGEVGYPGLVCDGADVIVDSCIIDRCGGGGILSTGKGSLLKVAHCIVKNNRQVGLEVRNDGELIAVENEIENNQFHGVLVGPYGKATLCRNHIFGNGNEGIYCLEHEQIGASIPNHTSPKYSYTDDSKTVAEIDNNIISHNGLCGISLDGGTFIINGNKLFENWHWGLMAKTRSSCCLINNDIFSNKCGGLKLGFNHSAVVYIDGNTFRDNTGPAIHLLQFPPKMQRKLKTFPFETLHLASEKAGTPSDELIQYTRIPVITNRNVRRNNDLGIQHPSTETVVSNVCSFCHRISQTMKHCSKCKKSTYCSKACQTNHWMRHKHFCKLISSKFTVLINMSKTSPNCSAIGKTIIRMFDPSLKGIGEGPAPNPKSTIKFIVKIQSEYSKYDPNSELTLYDRSTKLDFRFKNPQLYYLIVECGVLGANKFTSKKIYCWAAFENGGRNLKIYTDNLPPIQTW